MSADKEWKSLGIKLVQDDDGSFRLIADKPAGKRYLSCSGSGDRQTFTAVDKDGNRSFVPDRVIDQYAYIQSFKDECLIENIIKRAVGGDVTVLSKVQGQYGDFTETPTDLRGLFNVMNDAKGVFDALSEEEKAKYGDNFDDFIGSFATAEGIMAFLQSQSPQVATPVEEVKTDA